MIYRFKVQLHPHYETGIVDYITMYYDEDREEVIEQMHKYDKNNGFTFIDRHGRCNTCADLVLFEETYTGEVISKTSYHELFDPFNKRIGR